MNSIFTNLKQFVMIVVEFFENADRLNYAALGVSLLVAILYGRIMFRRRVGFNDLPEDFTRGVDYQWLKLKVYIFVMLAVGSGVLAYYQLPEWFPGPFKK